MSGRGPAMLPALDGCCCASRARKPRRAACAAFVRDVGVPADEIAFVDDAAAHVTGTRAAGLRAHRHGVDLVALERLRAAEGLPPQ